MTSPRGSDLPETGLLRDGEGRSWLILEGRCRALEASLGRLAPALLDGPAGALNDRILRAGPDLLRELAAAARDEPPSPEPTRLSAPLAAPGKIVALGRTFAAHARELGNEAPSEPLVFGKLAENLRGSGAAIVLPTAGPGERFDNEIELAVALHADLDAASVEEASAAIAGYCIANDFTWRSEQDRAKKGGQPWFLAKNLPGAIPCGPALVPAFLLPEPRNLRLVCRVDGEVVQDTDYGGMSGTPASLLAWLSGRLPLHAGDLVLLGTPAGVSSVAPGAQVEAEVAGLGVLRFSITVGARR